MSTTDESKVPFFKKGKSRPTTARKRSASPPSSSSVLAASTSSQTKTEVVLPARKMTGNILSTGTKRTAAQRRKDEGTLDNADYENSASREGPDVKWTSAGSHIHTAMEIIAGDEAEEMASKRQRKEKEEQRGSDNEAPDDGLYRGQKAYRSHMKKSQEVPKAMRVGPQRSTSTIRTATIVDYQPDVCKDYKETGYCGFGDTCKFLHDRGTYLAGWQLDRLAENPKGRIDESESDSDSTEDVPFACLICRKHFTDPVVTRCGHYYCSACAIKRYAKTPKCLACGAPTAGIFNRADKIFVKVNKKRGDEGEQGDPETDKSSAVKIEGLVEAGGDSDSDDSTDDG
ncbi:hypothetical protein EDC04DRAFT_2571129 [Pisolithus marmoratus]|nr:hypothetical protein EDC04DRAFT_2571129 [Pisolithus marmoratus]